METYCWCGHKRESHFTEDGLDYCDGCAYDWQEGDAEPWHGFEPAEPQHSAS